MLHVHWQLWKIKWDTSSWAAVLTRHESNIQHKIPIVLNIEVWGWKLMRLSSHLKHSVFHWKANMFFKGIKSILLLILLPSVSLHYIKMLPGKGRTAENKWNKILFSVYFNFHMNHEKRNCLKFCLLSLHQLLSLQL